MEGGNEWMHACIQLMKGCEGPMKVYEREMIERGVKE
jgi:hypothetical protein